MSSRVTVTFGANSEEFCGLVNSTIGSIRTNNIVVESLGLTGNETVRVDNGDGWVTVSDSYIVQEGDEIEFNRRSGGKGL